MLIGLVLILAGAAAAVWALAHYQPAARFLGIVPAAPAPADAQVCGLSDRARSADYRLLNLRRRREPASRNCKSGWRASKTPPNGPRGSPGGCSGCPLACNRSDCASPKSRILTSCRCVRKMFADLMSRCTIPAPCAVTRALAHWMPNFITRSTDNGPPATSCFSERPTSNCMTRKGLPSCWSTSKMVQMLA